MEQSRIYSIVLEIKKPLYFQLTLSIFEVIWMNSNPKFIGVKRTPLNAKVDH
jgi:hypothetical protein